MEFRILGALDVTAHGVQVDLGGLTRRAVLGYLLLHPNQVVPASQLRDALWHGDPPPTARKIVQNAISAIRKIIADRAQADPATVLLTKVPGYLLEVDPDAVDLCRFRRLVEQGRAESAAGSPAAAQLSLRRALQLWHGNALADLAEAGILWRELTALADERLNAYEDCFDAELACGRHREITPELEILTAAAPLREGLCRQYMLALYRSGRQVDALGVYQRSRANLVDGLGIEPGRDLQRLHQMILTQDASLQTRKFRPPA
ncbi:AfsR/SARP family transcriptional regulator [Nocardia iowensis]|uniref:AfsR/SARP family transcriptional regulator n=1 Tax=Nocardia iowensis TaxID=204891 RepID=A0ABX8RJ90_NOCIO|nr:AfsR/SARP family transcriptional regulator [Nocardia iowensis]QXN88355.1 AfsR/SARP family transcriptional regulator [Nocardia iowensis]